MSGTVPTELVGKTFPQRHGFQGQRYGAGILLPDLPAELALTRAPWTNARRLHGALRRFDLAHDPEFLGHKLIQHTVRYTELAPTRLKNLFRDSA